MLKIEGVIWHNPEGAPTTLNVVQFHILCFEIEFISRFTSDACIVLKLLCLFQRNSIKKKFRNNFIEWFKFNKLTQYL